jgi:hypothetical protein
MPQPQKRRVSIWLIFVLHIAHKRVQCVCQPTGGDIGSTDSRTHYTYDRAWGGERHVGSDGCCSLRNSNETEWFLDAGNGGNSNRPH